MNRHHRTLHWIAVHSLGLALGAMFLLPLVFVLLTAFMSDEQALTAELWPRDWHWENFAEVFVRAPMLSYLGNSLLYSGLATAFMLVSSVPVAYALSKLRWRGRNAAFLLVIAAMMLPPQVTAVPLYILWARFDLTGSLWPLIIPHLFGDAFSIFLLRQFFLTIPQSYVDAAKVDGCGELGAMLRVVVPMARPGIAAAAMFCFLYTWNDFFGPLLYTGEDESRWPLSVGLASFRGMHHVEWNLTMAATVLVMLPVVVLFLVAQRAFVRGITFTGVKG
ncbi:carbohydrate ABC transporter membrane protein 2 (CUT1 family) [Saccharopolyspora erythraea NRRL 2338]|uniref:Sugar transport membrane protein n=2 Tax=Saccharopolyspora erythraea TaxID=1836 RepID=A4FA35_SACEN|nr:carbohydrate ABC transporter permease [Saccharopolyspora erythraea]EQD82816.1 sugar ABC transporter permease [Saccharopolyspora erythraea D]PFG94695.1 carbohydrate ABC transporter membrane protein 2 (CUT1 family) [Saccharopolyspora erythraea NRRL 2338]QRK91422.1 carbohydrate ABC transporter permease [Saccharopolyspora erythraea]CAM00910.1 putative sugar transport membrane protein [Saccharopolyspora erythraea NRRL 2338]